MQLKLTPKTREDLRSAGEGLKAWLADCNGQATRCEVIEVIGLAAALTAHLPDALDDLDTLEAERTLAIEERDSATADCNHNAGLIEQLEGKVSRQASTIRDKEAGLTEARNLAAERLTQIDTISHDLHRLRRFERKIRAINVCDLTPAYVESALKELDDPLLGLYEAVRDSVAALVKPFLVFGQAMADGALEAQEVGDLQQKETRVHSKRRRKKGGRR